MTKFLRLQKKNDSKSKNLTAKIQPKTPLPPRLITQDFMVLAQKKNNIIEKILQERANIMGRINTYEDLELENMTSDMKKSSTDQKSKRSDDGMDSKRSPEMSQNINKNLMNENYIQNSLDNDEQIAHEIELIETNTISLFINQSFWIQNDNPEILSKQEEINKQYDEQAKNMIGNDNFIPHMTQTYIQTQKVKETQTSEKETNDFSQQTFHYEINELMKQPKKSKTQIALNNIHLVIQEQIDHNDQDPFTYLPSDLPSIKFNFQKFQSSTERVVNKSSTGKTKYLNSTFKTINSSKSQTKKLNENTKDLMNVTQNTQNIDKVKINNAAMTTLINNYMDQELQKFKESLQKENQQLVLFEAERKIYSKESLKRQVEQVEKILNLDVYNKKYLNYRNYPDPALKFKQQNMISFKKTKEKEIKKDEQNLLEPLFTYEFQNCLDLTVNEMNFNPVNQDLFVAGYGDFNQEYGKGLLALWTLKNPKYPESFIETPSPILSVKFSQKNPNLFGCGFANGNLHVYDTRQSLTKTVVKSEDLMDLKHMDAIWNVDWVSKGQKGNKGESLVTISSDGKLFEWNLKKNLEVQELKIINQVTDALKDEISQKNINFRYSSGFCFDFHKKDQNIYFISTEDGNIHRCSKSYKERYLDNYFGHTGPVYKVRCNPFDSDIFLSSSADWTCRIWNAKIEEPLYTLKSLDLLDEVYDIQWNPFCSTSFVNVCKDGRLELWDLTKKNFDPIFCYKNEINPIPRTSVVFSNSDPVIMSGQVNGQIEVFRYYGYEKTFVNHDQETLILGKILNVNKNDKQNEQ